MGSHTYRYQRHLLFKRSFACRTEVFFYSSGLHPSFSLNGRLVVCLGEDYDTVLPKKRNAHVHSSDKLRKCLVQAELVLTAHPTEINRRTLLVKHQEVARKLEDLEQIDRTGGVQQAGRSVPTPFP